MDFKSDLLALTTMYISAVFTLYTTLANPIQMNWEECQTRKKNDPTITQCCVLQNKKVMPLDNTKLCCNGTYQPIARDQHCCRDGDTSSLYDSKVSKCSSGKVISHGTDEVYCGDKLYNTKTHLCCANMADLHASYHIIKRKRNFKTCPTDYCNNQPYDASKKTCCNDKLLPAKANHSCCGDGLFHRHTQVCCDGQKHQKIGQNPKCCGKLYMRENQICCDEKILGENERCCGERPYVSSVSQCTDDSKLVPIGTPLCANREFNPEKQVCCGHFIMLKNKADDDACCKPRGHKEGMTYNTKNMTCQGGHVYSTVKCGKEHISDQYTCCSGFAYNRPTINSVCCDGRAEQLERDSDQEEKCQKPLYRCNNEYYDNELDDCCGGKLIKRDRFQCIDQRVYNIDDNGFPTGIEKCGIYAISKIVPGKFPSWTMIECRSNRMTGRIVKTVKNHGRIIAVILRDKMSDKNYTIDISNGQVGRRRFLRKNVVVTVYYEKAVENNLLLGECGTIERQKRRNRKLTINHTICKQIDELYRKLSASTS